MSSQKDGLTPLMRQYNEFKAKYPDVILLYRVGDFYETFGQDAEQTSKILNIVLTKRSATGQDKLAGFPYHALDNYLAKFIAAGKKVAVCDQIEDPKLSKGIVKRAITEISTPAITTNFSAIDSQKANYLCAIVPDKSTYGIAFIDICSGEFFVYESIKEDVLTRLKNFKPKEIVLPREFQREFEQSFCYNVLIKTYDDWVFTKTFANDLLTKFFDVENLKGFGIDKMDLSIIAAGACLYYIQQTGHKDLTHITNISRLDDRAYVWLDDFTINNLELVSSFSGSKATLLNVLDKTSSAMASRLMRRWILFPLVDKKAIEDRQAIVKILLNNDIKAQEIKKIFLQIGDMERLVSKIALKRIAPNELFNLTNIIEQIDFVYKILISLKLNNDITDKLKGFDELKSFLLSTLSPEAPNNINKLGAIKTGYNTQLDNYRQIAYGSEQLLNDILQKAIQQTGINSLKIGNNNVFGYYLEVTNNQKHKVPPTWQRKQTLTNCERYITDELKEIEVKAVDALEQITILETTIYGQIIEKTLQYIISLQRAAQQIATLDCLLSFAIVAQENNYTCCQIVDEDVLHIVKGRHPVIEKLLPVDKEYTANDMYLDSNNCQISIITGPNMSGKSAYLRQCAIIVIMAQIGSFVPALSAKIGLRDKIFVRVGASDNIGSGESTFMVEMAETASILNNISSRSLILLDEIGRGTSTYDGLSIAWAVTAFLHESKYRPKVLFATHYHEMIQLESHYKRIKNFHINVRQIGKKIMFLHSLVPGGTNQSYGIYVAKLAGIPSKVIQMADELLEQLEKKSNTDEIIDSNNTNQSLLSKKTMPKEPQTMYQTTFIQLKDPVLLQIKEELLAIDIDHLTPIEALNELNKIKKLLKKV